MRKDKFSAEKKCIAVAQSSEFDNGDRLPALWLCDRYRSLLLDGIAPFWLKHGIDWEHGGVLTCMAEDGSSITGDKFIWSQARSLWTFSALYNRIEKRPEFLR